MSLRPGPGGPYLPLTGETGSSSFLEGADFPGAGTYYLVVTTTPSLCGTALTSPTEIPVVVTTRLLRMVSRPSP